MAYKDTFYKNSIYHKKHSGFPYKTIIFIVILIAIPSIAFSKQSNKLESLAFGAQTNFDKVVIRTTLSIKPKISKRGANLTVTINGLRGMAKKVGIKRASGEIAINRLYQAHQFLTDVQLFNHDKKFRLKLKFKKNFSYDTFSFKDENNKNVFVINIRDTKRANLIKAKSTIPKLIVAIDAGHGGKDIGAKGGGKIYEKNVILTIAKQINKMINNGSTSVKSFLVREDDQFLYLAERRRISRQNNADVFISLHADSFESNVAGASIFVLSKRGVYSKMQEILHEQNNAYDRNSLENFTQKISGRTMQNSNILANIILDTMLGRIDMHKKKVQNSNFIVLKSLDIPSVLIELGFLTNKRDRKLLTSKKYINKVSALLVKSLEKYAARKKKELNINNIYVHKKHKIKFGDTLSGISTKYNVPIKVIKKLNRKKIKGNKIYRDKVIKVPVSANLINDAVLFD